MHTTLDSTYEQWYARFLKRIFLCKKKTNQSEGEVVVKVVGAAPLAVAVGVGGVDLHLVLALVEHLWGGAQGAAHVLQYTVIAAVTHVIHQTL